eukprot:482334-Prymnesium_polylepis.1
MSPVIGVRDAGTAADDAPPLCRRARARRQLVGNGAYVAVRTMRERHGCSVGTHLVRAVVALVADAHERARAHVRVAHRALAVTLLA